MDGCLLCMLLICFVCCTHGQMLRGTSAEDDFSFRSFKSTLDGNDAVWWHTGGASRTISPTCSSGTSEFGVMNYDDLIAFVDKVHDQGVRILAINAIYDAGPVASDTRSGFAGYDHGAFWCGLAGSDYLKPNRYIFPDGFESSVHDGSKDGGKTVKNFVKYIHDKDMRLLSWMNPSYIWTGSEYYTKPGEICQANAYGKCEWFRWAQKKDVTIFQTEVPDWQTLEPSPMTVTGDKKRTYAGGWVQDGDLAYYSYWFSMPMIDWSNPGWNKYWQSIVSLWLETYEVDGFVFDDPTAYLPGGYKSGDLYTNDADNQLVTTPMKSIITELGKKAAFAELYEWDGPGRAENYGIDSYHGDSNEDLENPNYRALYIEESVRMGSASYEWNEFKKFDDAFSGAGGTDAAVAWCAKTAYCANTWQRVAVGPAEEASTAPYAVQELIAILTAGTIPDVVYNTKGFYWQTFDWAGQDNEQLKSASKQVQTERALNPLALRAPACFSGAECTGSSPKDSTDQIYAMVRYNALFSDGEFAFVLFCFSDTGCKFGNHKVDVAATLSWKNSARFPSMDQMQKQIDADGDFASRGTRIYVGDNFKGPQWEASVERNCYEGAGSDYNPDGSSGERLSLSQCFLYCAGDASCNAITVKWMSPGDIDFDNFELDSTVMCYRRHVKSAADCEDAGQFKPESYSTFVMRA